MEGPSHNSFPLSLFHSVSFCRIKFLGEKLERLLALAQLKEGIGGGDERELPDKLAAIRFFVKQIGEDQGLLKISKLQVKVSKVDQD